MIEQPHRNRFLATAVAVTASAALLLSGCAGPKTTSEQRATAHESQQNSPTSDDQQSASASATDASSADSKKELTTVEKFETVVKTAQQEISGGKVTEYEYDPSDGPKVYEVTVIDKNKKKFELDIDASGQKVTDKDESGALNGNDLKEFDAAKISIEDAVKKAREKAGDKDSTVSEVELDWDSQKNLAVWEITLHSKGAKIKLNIDAAKGTVVER